MIYINAVFDENNTASPAENPNLKFGNFFDGQHYLYFESDEERINYLKKFETETP